MPALFTLILWSALITHTWSSRPSVQDILTPVFKVPTDSEATRSFPAINSFDETKLVYRPTHPTVFYQNSVNNNLDLKLTIENVVNCTALKATVMCECNPNSAIEINEKLVSEPIVMCSSKLSINIQFVDSVLRSSTYRVTLRIQTQSNADQLISDPLNHFQRLNFRLRTSTWDVKTNYIYLKRWLWPGRMFPNQFITDEAKRFLLTMPPGISHTVFHRIQFLTPDASRLIDDLSIIDKSVLSIGALLQINSGGFNLKRDHLRLMTDNYPRHTDSFDMKMVRINWETGVLHFSPNGLRRAADALVQITKEKNICRTGTIRNCAIVSGVNLLYNPLLNQDVRYTSETELLNEEVQKDIYSDYSDDSRRIDECSLLQNYSKTVTVVAGVEKTILCPIICSHPDTPYGFYKESVPMAAYYPEIEKFTRYGTVQVHKSGAAIKFDTNATHVDSGKYSCVAKGVIAEFQVNVFLPPSFNVTNTALTGGFLPPKVFVFEGDDYTLNCTVFYSGIQIVRLKSYVVSHPWRFYSVSQDISIFEGPFRRFGTKINQFKSSNAFSTTLTINVLKVPPFEINPGFHHYYGCMATAPENPVLPPSFYVRTETNVVVLERPKLDNFIIQNTSCCQTECFQTTCQISIAMRPDLLAFLNAVGITVRAKFITPVKLLEPLLNKMAKKHSSFNKATANLSWSMSKGFNQLVPNEAFLFYRLVPEFTYENPIWGGQAPNIHIIPHGVIAATNIQAATICFQDKACVYSTVLNQLLTEAITFNRLLGLTLNSKLNYSSDKLNELIGDQNNKPGPGEQTKKGSSEELNKKPNQTGTTYKICPNVLLITLIVALNSISVCVKTNINL